MVLCVAVRIEKNTLFCPHLLFSCLWRVLPLLELQRKMLQVSMSSGEADVKRKGCFRSLFWNPLWAWHLLSSTLLMSAAQYTWVSLHNKHMPGYVWRKGSCFCVSRAFWLGQPCWRQKTPEKTNCHARVAFWSWGGGVDHDKEHRKGRRWADRLQLGTRVLGALDCWDKTGARGGDMGARP